MYLPPVTKRHRTFLTGTNILIVVTLLVLAALAFAPEVRVRLVAAREDAIARDLLDLAERLAEAKLTGPDRDTQASPGGLAMSPVHELDSEHAEVVVVRAADYGNPFRGVFEAARHLHTCLDDGAAWLIVDLRDEGRSQATMALALALARIARRAELGGGARRDRTVLVHNHSFHRA